MTQKDALALCLGMINAACGIIAAAPAGEIPYAARLIAMAIVAACGFGLLFMDKLGKEPDEKPKKRKPLSQPEVDQIVNEMETYLKRTPAKQALPPTPRYPKPDDAATK